MKVEHLEKNKLVLTFDDVEIAYLISEATANDITVIEMIEMLFGMLFIGGYSNIIGKEM